MAGLTGGVRTTSEGDAGNLSLRCDGFDAGRGVSVA